MVENAASSVFIVLKFSYFVHQNKTYFEIHKKMFKINIIKKNLIQFPYFNNFINKIQDYMIKDVIYLRNGLIQSIVL